MSYNGVAIDNVYPYDRAGRLLQDVRLYDPSGRPLDFGRDFANTDRRIVRDAQGAGVFNAFPIRYFEPGTTLVANPQAGPPIAAPRITTPPLDAGRQETTARPTPTPTPAPANETTPPPTSTPTPAPTNEPR